MAFERWKDFFGLEVLKAKRNGKGYRSEIKFFLTAKEREDYVKQYIYNRPANANKVHLLKRFKATTSDWT